MRNSILIAYSKYRRRNEMVRETYSLLEAFASPRPCLHDFPNPHTNYLINTAPRTTLFGMITEENEGFMRRTGYRPGVPCSAHTTAFPIPIYRMETYTDNFIMNYSGVLARQSLAKHQVFPLQNPYKLDN